MAHQVIIDCDRRRITAYTQDGICVIFQGDKHDVLPRGRLWVARVDDRLAGNTYPGG